MSDEFSVSVIRDYYLAKASANLHKKYCILVRLFQTNDAGHSFPEIKACIFDMDGLLIDSENLYTFCTNEVLHEFGRPDIPWSIKAKLQGRPGPEAGRILQEWAQLPISQDEFTTKIKSLQAEVFPRCKALPGVLNLLQTLHNLQGPKIYLALATSSHRTNFLIKTKHLSEMFSVFPEDRTILGDDSRIPTGRGKPAPDIYLLALKAINDGLIREGISDLIKPNQCLVFEDSVPGVESGRRAGMQVVWCPHPGLLNEYSGREKYVLAGLTGEHKEDIMPQIETVGQCVSGAPGKIDDGKATLLLSLENFPYERFGFEVEIT